MHLMLHVGNGVTRIDQGKIVGPKDHWHAKKRCFHIQTMLIKTTLDAEFCVATGSALSSAFDSKS
jgi:hypothetical protein